MWLRCHPVWADGPVCQPRTLPSVRRDCPLQLSDHIVRLQNKFERTILPKIKDQIAGLDQQDNPNQAMIELRRELTVRLLPKH